MTKEFSKPIKNDGSVAFRECVMDYCFKPIEMPIRITREEVEHLLADKSVTVIFEKGGSLAEMTENIQSCKERFSRCVLKMVYLKYNPRDKLTMEDVWDRNGFVSLFANTENPLWGLAPDRTIESKMEMMFAYSPIHSDYNVIRINNYKEFEPYRRLGKEWCISDGEDIFNVYAEDGKNTLYLLKRKDVHKVKRMMGEHFPKDDFGMSFIAVFVSDSGKILSTTSRWNALVETDQLLSIDELRQLLGPDFAKLK